MFDFCNSIRFDETSSLKLRPRTARMRNNHSSSRRHGNRLPRSHRRRSHNQHHHQDSDRPADDQLDAMQQLLTNLFSPADDLTEEMEDGSPDGISVYHVSHKSIGSHVIYSGTLTEMSDLPHGHGCLQDSNKGTCYHGNFRLGKRHGIGRMEFTQSLDRYCNAQFIIAEWSEGAISGKCVMKMFDGSEYCGYSRGYAFHGKGKMRYASGDVYEGDWSAGRHHGFGCMQYRTAREVYCGMWSRDEYHGLGWYLFSNGDVYQGMFKENKSNGFGTMVSTNLKYANFHVGLYANDERCGEGLMVSKKSLVLGKFQSDSVAMGSFIGTSVVGHGKIQAKENGKLKFKEEMDTDGNTSVSDVLKGCVASIDVDELIQQSRVEELEGKSFSDLKQVLEMPTEVIDAYFRIDSRHLEADDCEFSNDEDKEEEEEEDEHDSELESFIVSDTEEGVCELISSGSDREEVEEFLSQDETKEMNTGSVSRQAQSQRKDRGRRRQIESDSEEDEDCVITERLEERMEISDDDEQPEKQIAPEKAQKSDEEPESIENHLMGWMSAKLEVPEKEDSKPSSEIIEEELGSSSSSNLCANSFSDVRSDEEEARVKRSKSSKSKASVSKLGSISQPLSVPSSSNYCADAVEDSSEESEDDNSGLQSLINDFKVQQASSSSVAAENASENAQQKKRKRRKKSKNRKKNKKQKTQESS